MAIILPYRVSDATTVLKRPKPESPFQKSKALQERYARALRGVSREVGKLVKGYNPTDLISAEKLKRALRAYSEILGPWALHLVNSVVKGVENQDRWAWQQHSRTMSYALQREILNAPIGDRIRELMAEQVRLIQSIPLEAAERVHSLVLENIYRGERAEDITKKIMETESVSKSKATLIARTEVARAASVLTQSRAEYVKSPGYIWRTSKDLLVRKSHRKMEGKFIKWSEPPTLIDGTITHAGQIFNCRCWTSPVLQEEDFK